jgi:hypothetical protein
MRMAPVACGMRCEPYTSRKSHARPKVSAQLRTPFEHAVICSGTQEVPP